MPIQRTYLIDDDGTGTTGTVWDNAELQAVYDAIETYIDPVAAAGTWISVPYSPGLATASAPGVWTVEPADWQNFAYMIIGKSMWVSYSIGGTSVSGAPSTLQIALPAGKVGSMLLQNAAMYVNAPTAGGAPPSMGVVNVLGGGTVIRLLKDPSGAPWADSVNGTTVFGNLVIPIN
jgi:hypothetical protein